MTKDEKLFAKECIKLQKRISTILNSYIDKTAILDESEMINEAEDTLSIMSKYVDNIELEVPKNDLNKLLQSLYSEAQSLDIL